MTEPEKFRTGLLPRDKNTVIWEYFDEGANVLMYAEARADAATWLEPGHNGEVRYARRTDPDGTRHLFDVVHPESVSFDSEKKREKGLWTTRGGVVIPIEEMEPRHAAGIVRYLKRAGIWNPDDAFYGRIAERAAVG